MKDAAVLTLALLTYLEQQHIKYCLVGDCVRFPQSSSDIDIVVEEQTLHTLPFKLQRFCAEQRLSLIRCTRDTRGGFRVVLSWIDVGRVPCYIVLDVYDGYRHAGHRLLTAESLLAAPSAVKDVQGQGHRFWQASPASQFIYCLLKHVVANALTEAQCEYLSAQWDLDPPAATQLLHRYWGRTPEARLLAGAAGSGDWTAVRKMLPRIRRAMVRRVRQSRAKESVAYDERRASLQSPGLTIVIIGPQGSMEPNLLEQVELLLGPAFPATLTMRSRPRLLPGADIPWACDVTQPQFRLGSIAFVKLVYVWLDYLFGWVWRVRPLLTRGYTVLFEHHFADLLADERRFKHPVLFRIAKLLGAFVPRPDLWLVLDAPAQILQTRNRELQVGEAARQRDAYRHLLDTQRNVIMIDAAQPVSGVACDIAAAILECSTHATARRLGLPLKIGRNPRSSRLLLWCSRHRVPFLSNTMRVLFNSDICCKVPVDLLLPHPYGIVIHPDTVLGRRVTIMQQATLSSRQPHDDYAPIIGDDVYIGTGAKILGAVHIGAGATITANAVVTQDVPAYATIVGVNQVVERESVELTLTDEAGLKG